MANPRHKASPSDGEGFILLGHVLLSLSSVLIYLTAMAYWAGSQQWVIAVAIAATVSIVAGIWCLVKSRRSKR